MGFDEVHMGVYQRYGVFLQFTLATTIVDDSGAIVRIMPRACMMELEQGLPDCTRASS